MAKQSWKGSALLGPVPPTLVTCGSMEQPNIFTVAWTGIINTIPAKTYISVRPQRFSYPLIEASGQFVINLPTRSLVRAVDYCGVKSGRDVNKWEAMGLHTHPAFALEDCPLLAESPVSLECRVTDKLELGSHHMFLADIVAVDVEESLLDKEGKLRLDRCGLLAYAHGDYYALGERLGSFGYSVRKKPAQESKKKKPKAK